MFEFRNLKAQKGRKNNWERGQLPATSDVIPAIFTHPVKDAFSTGLVVFCFVFLTNSLDSALQKGQLCGTQAGPKRPIFSQSLLSYLLLSTSIRLNARSCQLPAKCQQIVTNHLQPPCLVLGVNLKQREKLQGFQPSATHSAAFRLALEWRWTVCYLSVIKQVWKLRASIRKLL